MKNKLYKLSDFEEIDIKRAKEFIKTAIEGFLAVTLNEKVDNLFDVISETQFTGVDTFKINYTIETIGNDLLSALGCAINERKKE